MDNTGMKIQISKKGLQYTAEQTIKVLIKSLLNTKIKDVENSDKYKGQRVEYGLSNMRLVSFPVPQTIIETSPLTWRIYRLSASLEGEWHYKVKGLIKLRDHGSFRVSVNDWAIQVYFELLTNDAGVPLIRALNSICTEGSCSLHINSKVSWFYNMFRRTATHHISSELKHVLERESLKVVNEKVAEKLKTWTMETILYENISLDCGLTQSPMCTPEWIEFFHKGSVKCGTMTDLDITVPSSVKLFQNDDKMVSFYFSLEYILNTLAKVEYLKGKFKCPIPLSDVMKAFTSTEQTGATIDPSPLVMLFPDILLKFTKNPDIFLQDGAIQIVCPVSILAEGTNTVLLSAMVSFSAEILLSLEGNNIIPEIRSINVDKLSVESSPILPINDMAAKDFLEAQVLSKLLPKLQKQVQNGIKLPKLDKIDFINTEVSFDNGILVVRTDIQPADT